MDSDGVRRLVRAMPKAELHLHLDGSVLPGTAVELARTRGIDGPTGVDEMRAALVAPPHGASQAALLGAFDLPIALLQDAAALEQVTTELVEAKASDRVRYVEIRWAPALHTRRGLTLEAGITAVCAGAASAGARTGVIVRLICTAMRSHPPDETVRLAHVAGRFIDSGLTGFDLAGPEAAHPDPLVHRRAFTVARAAGLHVTLHAGEWGGPAQVRRALALDPERIAHGGVASEDPALCAELIRRAISLDLCPTSNVQAGIVDGLADHPLARLHRLGVPVTLSTDDLTVSDVTLSEEYARSIEQIGLTVAELWAINLHALEVAFCDPSTLARLRAEFRGWAVDHPGVDPASRS